MHDCGSEMTLMVNYDLVLASRSKSRTRIPWFEKLPIPYTHVRWSVLPSTILSLPSHQKNCNWCLAIYVCGVERHTRDHHGVVVFSLLPIRKNTNVTIYEFEKIKKGMRRRWCALVWPGSCGVIDTLKENPHIDYMTCSLLRTSPLRISGWGCAR